MTRETVQIESISRLVGAALSLGAESVPPLSNQERKLVRGASPERLAAPDSRQLRESILSGFDPLGEAFCRVFSPSERRSAGATYTPAPIVRAMTDWASNGPTPERIIDPGSGSARFAIAAGLAFPTARLIAIELDPLAALISRANFAVMGLGSRARVLVNDYRTIPQSRDFEGRSLYIGNPPYVRHHQIAPEWKTWLQDEAASRGLRASQLAGLHVHFFLATALAGIKGDRGVFITSAEWLDVNYGRLVRELLLDGLGGSAIHVVDPEAQAFEDAQTTASITCFEIGSQPKSLRLKRVKTVKDLGTLEGGQRVRRERLLEARRWTPLLRAARKVPAGHIELGEICRVHRGAVTGANRFWVIDPSASDLPASVLYPTVTRARELFAAGRELADSQSLRAVVDLPEDLDVLPDEDRQTVDRFMKVARKQKVDKGYIAQSRRAWWSVGLREPAPILATYMARRPPAFVRNLAEARHINIAHGLYPREALSNAVLDRIAAALHGVISLSQGRTYAGGLTKFEPKEMERLLIPSTTVEG